MWLNEETAAPQNPGEEPPDRDLVRLARDGFEEARVDGVLVPVSPTPTLGRYQEHDIEVVVDRLVVREGIEQRLADSLETALALADGRAGDPGLFPQRSQGHRYRGAYRSAATGSRHPAGQDRRRRRRCKMAAELQAAEERLLFSTDTAH